MSNVERNFLTFTGAGVSLFSLGCFYESYKMLELAANRPELSTIANNLGYLGPRPLGYALGLSAFALLALGGRMMHVAGRGGPPIVAPRSDIGPRLG